MQNCKFDIKKDVIQIYDPDQDIDKLSSIINFFPTNKSKKEIDQILQRQLTFSPVFKFILIDNEKRIFQTLRYCYLGSIDDWIPIGKEDILYNLLKRYLKHIGKESYFKLGM